VFRIILVIPVIVLLLKEEFVWALILFAIAGCSDALDGFLAKHFNWTTRLGSIIDPLADKLLLVSSYVALGWLTVLPWWLVAVVLLRDLVIVLGAIAYHLLVGEFDMAPTLISKINTLLQILLVLLAVVHEAGFVVTAAQLEVAIVAVAVSTILSGVHYVVVWGRRAMQAARTRGGA
jgi:cardiolipin synthase